MQGFNSRAHGGRDIPGHAVSAFGLEFQFTRPRGARHIFTADVLAAMKFQFTRPRGARLSSSHGQNPPRRFQFTRPRGARQRPPLIFGTLRSFNSRAHGGRDLHYPRLGHPQVVSIHAPTGGATTRLATLATCPSFNSRAHGGRDKYGDAVSLQRWTFQFTRPRGARPVKRHRTDTLVVVSIHAPTGGATHPSLQQNIGRSFNSRAHGGRDCLRLGVCLWHKRFQFTRPRGARPAPPRRGFRPPRVSIHAPTGGATWSAATRRSSASRFNSRAHGGRDLPVACTLPKPSAFQFTRPRGARHDFVIIDIISHLVSIHAPTGGATRIDDAALANNRFNSRAHGGRDRHDGRHAHARHVSIHAPTGGATPNGGSAGKSLTFQFTRPRGARQSRPKTRHWQAGFNSRAHGGRDHRRY